MRRLAITLAIILVLTGCSAPAALPDARRALEAGAAHYSSVAASWEEGVAAMAAGAAVDRALCERCLTVDDQHIPTERLAGYLFLLSSAGVNFRSFAGVDLSEMLVQRQKDGSFGFLSDTVMSALALENAGVIYDLDGVLRSLIPAQRADGLFEDAASTGLALSLLSTIDDARAATMAARAAEYLLSAEPADSELPFVVMGLADAGEDVSGYAARLCEMQGEDGGFSDPFCLAALAAALDGGSIWTRNASAQAMILIQVVVDGKTVETGRVEPVEGCDALELTKRYCAEKGVEIVTVQGEIVQIGEYDAAFKLAEGSSVAAGGSVIWSN